MEFLVRSVPFHHPWSNLVWITWPLAQDFKPLFTLPGFFLSGICGTSSHSHSFIHLIWRKRGDCRFIRWTRLTVPTVSTIGPCSYDDNDNDNNNNNNKQQQQTQQQQQQQQTQQQPTTTNNQQTTTTTNNNNNNINNNNNNNSNNNNNNTSTTSTTTTTRTTTTITRRTNTQSARTK